MLSCQHGVAVLPYLRLELIRLACDTCHEYRAKGSIVCAEVRHDKDDLAQIIPSEVGQQHTCTINKMIGFFASKCTGFTPSSTPPCGGALIGAVGFALAADAIDDMVNAWGSSADGSVQFPQIPKPQKNDEQRTI
jgi:hypothetical protein